MKKLSVSIILLLIFFSGVCFGDDSKWYEFICPKDNSPRNNSEWYEFKGFTGVSSSVIYQPKESNSISIRKKLISMVFVNNEWLKVILANQEPLLLKFKSNSNALYEYIRFKRAHQIKISEKEILFELTQ